MVHVTFPVRGSRRSRDLFRLVACAASALALVGCGASHAGGDRAPLATSAPAQGTSAPLSLAIAADYPGASAEEVEREVAVRLETALAGLPRLQATWSRSCFGRAVIVLQFAPGVEERVARRAVIERLAAVGPLPARVEPVLLRTLGSSRIVLRYTLHNPTTATGQQVYTTTDLGALEDNVIRPTLMRLAGVADVLDAGVAVKHYEVQPDPERLKRYGITLQHIKTAIVNCSANVGGDFLIQGKQVKIVRGAGIIGDSKDPIKEALTKRTPAEAAACLRAQEQARLRDLRAIVITAINNVPVKVDDLVQGGPLVAGALSTQGVVAGELPRSSRVSISRLRRDAQGRLVLDAQKNPVRLDENDVVHGVVLARSGRDAAAVTRAVLARIKKLNDGPGQLLPGTWIEPFPALPGESIHSGAGFIVQATFPAEATVEDMATILRRVSKALRQQGEVEAILFQAGQADDDMFLAVPHQAAVLVVLRPRAEWPAQPGAQQPRPQADLENVVLGELQRGFPGVLWRLTHGPASGGRAPFFLEKGEALVKIFGTDLERLQKLSAQVRARLQKVRGVSNVSFVSSGQCANLEFRVDLDKCKRWGVRVADVNRVIDNALRGQPVTQMVEGERTFDIVLRRPLGRRQDPQWILDLPVDIPSASEITPGPAPKKSAAGSPAPAQTGSVQVPRLRVRDLVTPVGKDGKPSATASFLRPSSACIYREDRQRFVVLIFRIQGRQTAAVLAEAREHTAALLPPLYRAVWQEP
jgi:Cu/Ag efflux pump CusA